MKKLVPMLFALVGLALVIAAFVVWFEPPKEGGVFSVTGGIISFLAGVGSSIKGWKDLFKKDEGGNSIKQELFNHSDSSTPIQAQTVNIYNNAPPPNAQLPNTQSHHGSTLPSQPFFFGRTKELEIIADAISPESRTWGALIDGPGGIGKTALAIRAAHLAPLTLFKRKIFISAKVRELTPEGEKPLVDFSRDNYVSMLNELALELGEKEIPRLAPDERANQLRMAMAGKKTLIIFDNLETLQEDERDRLFQFLSRLPDGNKAVATSRRRRSDIDARAIRLDRLSADEALALMAELAKNNHRLARENEKARRDLYEITNGNPLLIKWVCGQLGREGGAMHTIKEACKFIESAPKNNDPLEYIFGDLLETCTESETKILAALTHFTQPARIKWIADMTELAQRVTETALEDLTDRSILIPSNEGKVFFLPSLASQFIRKKRSELVNKTGDRLVNNAYALTMERGSDEYDRFPKIDAEWLPISAAFPLFVSGKNERLQSLCNYLFTYLVFSGKQDELLNLNRLAEEKAISAKDLKNAGWRAYHQGAAYHIRGQADEILVCANRAVAYWKTAGADEKAVLAQLYGYGFQLKKDYPAAIQAFTEAIEYWRSIELESDNVATGLDNLATAIHDSGNLKVAEKTYKEALRIARKVKDKGTIGVILSRMGDLYIDQEKWKSVEKIAEEALALLESIGYQEGIASNCYRLSIGFLNQQQPAKGLPYAQRAVEIFTRLRKQGNLQDAQETLAEIEKAIHE